VGRLTTHVLDTAQGCPANNVGITLYRIESSQTGDVRQLLKQDETNQDGRLDSPILNDDAFQPGVYELVFQAGRPALPCTITRFTVELFHLQRQLIMVRPKIHFSHNSGVSSILEPSCTSCTLWFFVRCFLALAKKTLFLEAH